MSTRRNSLFNDFLDASGFFEGDSKAWAVASSIKKNQRRKFYRYGILPINPFLTYLANSGIIRQRDIPNRKGMTLGDVLDFLSYYRYRTEQARSDGMHIREAILQADIPFLARSFAKGDFNWIKLQLYGATQKQRNSDM